MSNEEEVELSKSPVEADIEDDVTPDRVEKFLELDREAEESYDSQTNKALSKIGIRGSAYLRDYEHVTFNELPESVKRYVVEQVSSISDVCNLVVEEDDFVRLTLYHPDVGEFHAYEKDVDWERLAEICNQPSPSHLLERGIPIEYDDKRGTFAPKTSFNKSWISQEITNHPYAIFTTILTLTIPSLILLSVTLFTLYVISPFIALLLLPFFLFSSQIFEAILPPHFITNKILTGHTLPNTPYMENFDGTRDYLQTRNQFH